MSRNSKHIIAVAAMCVFSQSAMSQWTVRASFTNVNSYCKFGNSTACACDHGVFLVDNDGEITSLVKGSGLSSACVSAITADPDGAFLAVGYADGSIDLLSGGRLVNMPSVSVLNTLEPSRINHLTYTNALMAVASGFGVSLVDPERAGAGVQCRFPFPVDRVSIMDGGIYALSGGNVYFIDVTNVNPQDFDNWKVVKVDEQKVFHTDEASYNGPHPKSIPDDIIAAMDQADGALLAASSHFSRLSRQGIESVACPDPDDVFCSVFANPWNASHVFLGTRGGCLYEYLSSSLKQKYPAVTNGPIVSMACNPDGDLMLLSSSSPKKTITIYDHLGRWHTPWWNSRLPDGCTQIVSTGAGKFWIAAGAAGIVTVDLMDTPLDFSDDEVSVLYPRLRGGDMVGTRVECVAPCSDGHIYIGTDRGVAYSVDEEGAYFVRPVVTEDMGGGLDYSQYLLGTKHVSAIAEDAAGRKWISTLGAGVFCVSQGCDEQVMHFNQKNSPLPGDTVTAMRIVPKTGDIYFATTLGLASYNMGVVESAASLGHVQVYPNPVRPGYQGSVFVSGLEDGCDVRITDLSGHLVYKTRSVGGLVEWDGISLSGRRCASGVYLVFVVNVSNGHSVVKKLLIMR